MPFRRTRVRQHKRLSKGRPRKDWTRANTDQRYQERTRRDGDRDIAGFVAVSVEDSKHNRVSATGLGGLEVLRAVACKSGKRIHLHTDSRNTTTHLRESRLHKVAWRPRDRPLPRAGVCGRATDATQRGVSRCGGCSGEVKEEVSGYTGTHGRNVRATEIYEHATASIPTTR